MKRFIRRSKLIQIFYAISVFFVFTVFLSGCAKEKNYSNDFFAMDTWMSVQIFGNFSEKEADEHLQAVEALIRELENTLSVTLQASELYKINNSHEEVLTIKNNDFLNILAESLEYETLTDSAFSPRLYKVSKEWGFTTGEYKMPELNVLEKYLSEIKASEIIVDGDKVSKTPGIMLDFGAIAKGYATDVVVEYLRSNNILKAIINLGGNVYVHGNKDKDNGWSVGVNDPFADRLLGTLELSDACVVTSGNYERFFELDGVRYHHIIDGTTGYPADNDLVSVTIIAEDASYADALSTALFVMGLEDAIGFWEDNEDFEFIMVTENKEVYYSENLGEDVFCSNKELLRDNYILKIISKDIAK